MNKKKNPTHSFSCKHCITLLKLREHMTCRKESRSLEVTSFSPFFSSIDGIFKTNLNNFKSPLVFSLEMLEEKLK